MCRLAVSVPAENHGGVGTGHRLIVDGYVVVLEAGRAAQREPVMHLATMIGWMVPVLVVAW